MITIFKDNYPMDNLLVTQCQKPVTSIGEIITGLKVLDRRTIRIININ